MITLMKLYNEVTGQAWSMFDGEVEAQDEFETTVTTSLQKALSALWCSFNFPFRNKTEVITTENGTNSYKAPIGNIVKKTIRHQKVYGVKIGNQFLNYEPDFEVLEPKQGKPTSFYVKNNKLFLYPTPDDVYNVELEYWTINQAMSKDGISQATLKKQDDYIDIPEEYEDLFMACLMPLAMVYLIASDSDENTSGYKQQYEEAYKNLIRFTRGIELEKRIVI